MKLTKISATLGPTNTGKTFSAIEKLLSYSNGVIGFPLRLLARENFDYVKKQVGEDYVALVTGEEKIIPKEAKYFFVQLNPSLIIILILLRLMKCSYVQIMREAIFLPRRF